MYACCLGNRELDRLLKDIPSEKLKETPDEDTSEENKSSFTLRDTSAQKAILFDLFTSGVDAEDMLYFKMCYNKMLSNDDSVSC